MASGWALAPPVWPAEEPARTQLQRRPPEPQADGVHRSGAILSVVSIGAQPKRGRKPLSGASPRGER